MPFSHARTERSLRGPFISRSEKGIIEIAKCGGGFCITLKSGKNAGKQIGKLTGSGADYSGEITDPENDKTYSGSGAVSGNSLKLKGCVLKVLCKSQTWTRM